MARKFKTSKFSGKKILLVDDDLQYTEAIKELLKNEGHTIESAENGEKALAILHDNFYDLLLIDYYMPNMTGEELVAKIREFNKIVQIILQTGYASEQPPRELIQRLDIQGYYNKNEGPEKLLLWVDIGLKAAYTMQLLNKSRASLNYILDVTPDLHKMQPLEDLLQGILLQISGLLGINDTFLAILPYQDSQRNDKITEGFIAMFEDESELVIRAGTGKFVSRFKIEKYLEKDQIETIHKTLNEDENEIITTCSIVPLKVGHSTIGVIYIDQTIDNEENINLLNIFANQAAVAIQNTRLYQMATYDQLTNVFLRGTFLQSFFRELRIAYRSKEPISILMIDLDGLKVINDTIGHLGGDQALKIMGQALYYASRQNDIRGRLGGDEFAIILQNSTPEGARVVAGRIQEYLSDKIIENADNSLPVKCSIGICTLVNKKTKTEKSSFPIENQYFQFIALKMTQKADELLYKVKNSGGNSICKDNGTINWYDYEKAMQEYNDSDNFI